MKMITALFVSAFLASGTVLAMDNDRTGLDRDRTAGQHADAFLGSTPAHGMSADDLIGKTVKNRANDEDVGNVEDLVIDRDGKIVAAVISVGGFLGIGEKDVAVSWNQLSITRDDDDIVIHVDATEEQLENAPEFDRS